MSSSILYTFLQLTPLIFALSTSVYSSIIVNMYSAVDFSAWLAISSVSLALSVFGLLHIFLIYWGTSQKKNYLIISNNDNDILKNMRYLLNLLILFYILNVGFTVVLIIFLVNPLDVDITVENDKLKGSYGTTISILSYVTLGIGSIVLLLHCSSTKFLDKFKMLK